MNQPSCAAFISGKSQAKKTKESRTANERNQYSADKSGKAPLMGFFIH